MYTTPSLPTERQTTLLALEKIDQDTLLRLSHLTLPEIQALRQEVVQVLPVGNLPAFILGGLIQLKGRTVNAGQVKRDLHTLFQGISIVSQGLYSAFVIGPAAVLYGYQKLLQLAGKDIESAFPEGTWQFYLQFSLREDTARHTNETIGFYRAFPQADPVSAAAAWIGAIIDSILDYDDLLAADWSEHISLYLLHEIASQELGTPHLTRLMREWKARCPYACPSNGRLYLPHRRALFGDFLNRYLRSLSQETRQEFQERFQARQAAELDAYQRQMSLLCALQPGRYQEQREPIPVWRGHVGFVWRGRTYLLPLCQRDSHGRPLCYLTDSGNDAIPLTGAGDDGLTAPDGRAVTVDRGGRARYQQGEGLLGRLRPLPAGQVKGWLEEILSSTKSRPDEPPLDLLLASSPRSLQGELRGSLPPSTQAELGRLRQTVVILNWDLRPADAPLAQIRRGQRGVGDHPLTILRTGRSFVFDLSHIFFDGLWSMATAELLTNKAIDRYRQISNLPARPPSKTPRPLELVAPPETIQLAQAERHPGEVTAEDDRVQIRRLARLRQWLTQRGIRLTVNDLLLLYRFLYTGEYQPSPVARQAIEAFRARAAHPDARAAVQAIDDCLAQMKITNPALLIPMDASNISPRERIFPVTFRNPLVKIGEKIAAANRAYQTYRERPGQDTWEAFDRDRREALAYLRALGEVLDTLKAVTMRGESFNTATIRLLGHLPPSMQNLLDQIPQRIGLLNEIIKGTEVFSNVGRVAKNSSLSRFSSARDDGQTKWLIWGVLTDDHEVMRISLRDFRPFAPLLLRLENPPGRELADLLARDFLHGYVTGFNRFVAQLGIIVSEQKPAGIT